MFFNYVALIHSYHGILFIGGIMMKKNGQLLLLLLFPAMCFAQSGYKDFSWGMSVNDINALINIKNNHEDDYSSSLTSKDAFSFLVYYLNQSKITDTVPNPYFDLQESGYYGCSTTDGYWSNDTLDFHFQNNKLFAVATYFMDSSVLQELQSRYKNGVKICMDFGDGNVDAVIWNPSPTRFIVWEKYNTTSYAPAHEIVTYIDAKFFRIIADKSMTRYRTAIKKRDSRLD